MNWFLRLSIKNKLNIVILSVTLFAVGMGCTIMLLIELAHRKQEITENAMLIARTTGAYIAADVASADAQAVRDALNILNGNPDIINIHIYGATGGHFVSLYEKANIPSNAPVERTVKVTKEGLYVAEPLVYDGRHCGTIYEVLSIAPMQLEKIRHIVAAIILILTVLFFSYILANRLQLLISGPVIKLIDVTKQIRQHQSYAVRANTNLKDEIGELYLTFNQMMEQIDQHEIELRQSEEKWRALTENSPDNIMLVDQNGKILFINHTAPGLVREEVIGRCTSEFVDTRYTKRMQETYREVFRTGLPGHYEVEYESPHGVMVYESRVGPVKDNDEIVSLIISARDITDRKLTEVEKDRALKRLENLHGLDEAILKAHSPEAIANAALENIDELVPSLRSSVTLFDIPNKEVIVLAARGLQVNALEKGDRLVLDSAWGEIDALKKGTVHIVSSVSSLANISPVAKLLSAAGIKGFINVPLLANGDLIGTLNLSAVTPAAYSQEEIDIAKEISGVLAIAIRQANLKEQIQVYAEQLEQRVRERTADLEAANKEMESFSYSVSHDLRAPLRSIDGFSQLVLEEYKDKLNQKGSDYLRRVRNASQRMGKLIDELLALSRINRSVIDRQLVRVDKLAESVVNSLRELDPNRKVDFIVHDSINANGDPQLLRVVLENLLGNAWKFTNRTSHAVIEIGEDNTQSKHNGKTAIYVKDNGAGFDMNYAGKLFGAFQRLHSEEEFTGTGIGLASVQRIIHRHGGEIWAEGEVGRGAVFYFTLGK